LTIPQETAFAAPWRDARLSASLGTDRGRSFTTRQRRKRTRGFRRIVDTQGTKWKALT
jgi:hypothetical protein